MARASAQGETDEGVGSGTLLDIFVTSLQALSFFRAHASRAHLRQFSSRFNHKLLQDGPMTPLLALAITPDGKVRGSR
jgi:hypothetical protein